MTASPRTSLQFFDPLQEFDVIHRSLPHWSQLGTVAFITLRTWDSIPKQVLQTWIAERDNWLKRHGIKSVGPETVHAQSLDPGLRAKLQKFVSDRWNEHLDACYGQCVLRRSDLADVVARSFLHFNADRYELTDFVVMPNHVHLLVAFPDDVTMLRQCESWKKFTATQINRLLARKGRFWQQDGFDHLVRSLEQFEYLRRYIANNPKWAKLPAGHFIHWSKPL